jgi:SAM-dependent methyltransferase
VSTTEPSAVAQGHAAGRQAIPAPSQVIEGGSPDRFGYEWEHYPELRPDYERQFLRWTAPLPRDSWRDKTFLDVGCGMGRNSFWPMTYGARGGVAIDLDERSLAAARHTLAPYPTVRIVKGSAYELPYRDEFDVVFSIGVIQILEFPERAIQRMCQAAKPGGKVLIWVYGRENNGWIVHGLSPLRRMVLSRLPVPLVHFLSLPAAGLIYPVIQAGLLNSIEYFREARGFSFRHLRSIIFDQFLPRIAHYWSRDEVLGMMRRAELHDIQLEWVNQVSWTAVGTKAPA